MERGGDSGSVDVGGIGGHIGPFPPVTAPLVLGWEEVEHGQVGEGGTVPDGLHPGDRSLSLQERGCPGPTAIIGPLYGLMMPPQRAPLGTHKLPWAAHAAPPPATDHPDEGGQDICCPMEGNPQAKGT